MKRPAMRLRGDTRPSLPRDVRQSLPRDVRPSFPRAAAALAAAALTTLSAVPAARAADCPAEAGECQSLARNGSFAAAIDIVIIGDGYTEAQKDKFFADAQAVSSGLLGSETYKAYAGVFNVWALFKASAESGADDPSAGKFVNTAFNATYDTNNIDYLLSVSNAKVFAEVNARLPESDFVVCVVNATAYGGSGGTVAVISLDPSSLEIARHELGHTIGGLADEYTAPYPGYPEGDPEPNVALTENLDPPKWDMWLSAGVSIPTPINAAAGPHEPIGAYEGARYKDKGVFRPAPNCLMRELNVTFCPVCAEAMVRRFSELSLLIDAPSPASPAIIPAKGKSPFTATIPALSDLTFSWSVDGQPVAGADKTLPLDPSALGLADGPHQVTLTVYDASPLVRADPKGVMTETFTWSVAVDSSLPPANGAGGAGGEGGAGVGGAGGNGGGGGGGGGGPDTVCSCRAAGDSSPAPLTWSLLGLVPLAAGLRRRATPRRNRGTRPLRERP